MDEGYYMSGSKWDKLYRTSCEEPELVDRDGFCSLQDDIVPGCSTMEELEWVGNNRIHQCVECK